MLIQMMTLIDVTLLGQLGIRFKEKTNLSREEEEALMNRYQYKGATTNIHPLLSSRVNYAQPIKFPGFSKAEERNIHYHMSSFSENVALQHLRQNPIEFVNYNKRQMSRIYPKGGRVDSSNYMPQIFWNAGCQMVSLNFQTPDLPMQLNLGKFEYNGNCGYLLKPDFMRRPDRTFDPYAESPVDGVIAAFCSVRVISGQFLSDKKIGTYVEVDMYGLPADTIRKEYRTKTIPANGLNPRYDESVFEFRKIVLPDLAILRIAVYEETGKLIGQRVLPLDGLQAGYRHISLRTEGNFPLSLPTIFCQIILKSYVPDGLSAFVDQLNQPLLMKKTEDLLNVSITNSSDGGPNSSSSSIRRVRATDSTSTSTPSLDSKVTTTSLGASSISTTTVSTTDTTNLASSSTKPKTPVETIIPITLEYLREQKSFCKLKSKQDKELILMKKKHAKEQTTLGEQQSKTMSKAKADCEKLTRSPMLSSANVRKDLSNGGNLIAVRNDPKLMDLINEQNVEWTTLVQRQLIEMNTLRRQHTKEQCDLLRLLLDETQRNQIKEITERHLKEKKDLELSQVRQNIEDSKRLGSEKNIRNKSELDRRVRELKSNNTKKFVEERKRQIMKHEREKDNLTKSHETQKTTLIAEIDKMLEYSVNYQDETPMARFPSSSVIQFLLILIPSFTDISNSMDTKFSRLKNFLDESNTSSTMTNNQDSGQSWSQAIFSRDLFQTNINRVQSFFNKRTDTTMTSSSSTDDIQNLLQKGDNDPILPALSRKQRILGFMMCLAMGILCMALATLYIPVIVLKARKFAVLFSFGSLFFLSSFSMLWGPTNHFKHLTNVERLPFSITYLLTLLGTIYYSVWVKSYFFTILFAVLQLGALVWYIVSYIPGGARGLKFFSKLFYTFVSKTVTTTLSV
ncbi:hypothetical protein I4U23_021002 [Adineta vaga]|nr:hypothetical protein I4U23_021002 [Adineta vaga]